MKKIIAVSLIFIFGLSFIVTWFVKGEEKYSELETTIVIDAGHGGIDPGTHQNGVLEKDINLAIAKKLAQFLDRGSIKIIMTRTEDELYQDDRNKDLVHRKEVINQQEVDLAVSIHVNSFPSPNSSGGQTFYQEDCSPSKQLATSIQEQLRKVQSNNHRKIKPAPYYILKKSEVPTVITEVGFISNREERKKLTEPQVQKKLARAIGKGIINYLNSQLNKQPVQPTLANKIKDCKIYPNITTAPASLAGAASY